jgi:transposase
MPHSTFVEMPTEEQAEMLAVLRHAQYGSLLALHILWWCAAGRTPTDMAAVLCGSRSRVYRPGRASREGWGHDDEGPLVPSVRRTVLRALRRRSLVALLKATPRAYGGCRTRWSCATLALTWQAKWGITVSAETMRRWVHEGDWVWKRPTRVAKDDAPRRIERLARIRVTFERLQCSAAMVCADALDIHRLPKIGSAWMPTGMHRTVMTPGTHEPHLQVKGPWPYKRSDLSDEPAVTAAVENIAAEPHAKIAA